MTDFKIDENKCIKCSVCAGDCPVSIISMEYGFPHIKDENEAKCIGCQHCLAVCPTAALSIMGIDPDACITSDKIANADQTEALMRNRRSVRQFKQKNIEPEKLDRLIKVAANAPTGKNERLVSIHIIDDIDQMKRYVGKVYSHLETMAKEGRLPDDAKFFGGLARMYRESGIDIVFRGAPNLVLASAPKSASTPVADGHITLSYMDIMAPSLGLGTVWMGFLMHIFSFAPELIGELGIPEDHIVAYALLLGEPSVKYFRGVVRDDIQVNRVAFTD